LANENKNVIACATKMTFHVVYVIKQ